MSTPEIITNNGTGLKIDEENKKINELISKNDNNNLSDTNFDDDDYDLQQAISCSLNEKDSKDIENMNADKYKKMNEFFHKKALDSMQQLLSGTSLGQLKFDPSEFLKDILNDKDNSKNGKSEKNDNQNEQLIPKNSETNKLFIEKLRTLAEIHLQPLIVSKCAPYVVAKLADQEVEFLLDTGATNNVISESIAKKLGLESFIDDKDAGIASGIGKCVIVGKIPFINIQFGDVECNVNFSVIRSEQEIAILSFTFMQFYEVLFDFAKRKMNIKGLELPLLIKDHGA